MKKKAKIIIGIIIGVIATLSLVVAIPFTILGIKTSRINKKWDYLKEDINYKEKVEVTDINLVEQHISCGYATIEMLSTYYGNKVSEDDLSNKNRGAISTSSSPRKRS